MEYVNVVKVVLNTPVNLLGGPAIVGTLFGMTPLKAVLIQWFPVFYVSIIPLFMFLLALVGCNCAIDERAGLKFGARTAMRRVMLAVRAETRMNQSSKYSKLLDATGYKFSKGKASYMQPTASALESGQVFNASKATKSPDQAKGRSEEAAIKGSAKNLKKGKK